jgi:hypothetical protein
MREMPGQRMERTGDDDYDDVRNKIRSGKNRRRRGRKKDVIVGFRVGVERTGDDNYDDVRSSMYFWKKIFRACILWMT